LSGDQAVIYAHAFARERLPDRGYARLGQELVTGIFGVKPHLDRMSGKLDVVLNEGEGQPRCHVDLKVDEVDPRHALGHRMLDLQPGVHFQEVELSVAPSRNSTVPAPT
jgi:hypothetical protein